MAFKESTYLFELKQSCPEGAHRYLEKIQQINWDPYADDTERISQRLGELARFQGSSDNISVIVVFLREPHQITAEAHRWVTSNGQNLTTDNMETGLDNANNPFTNSNGSLKNLEIDVDVNSQKSKDGLLLNLTDNFKTNGGDIAQNLFLTEKANGKKKSASDIHFDDDLGPETNVDAVDEAFSPVDSFKDPFLGFKETAEEKLETFSEGIRNNNPYDAGFNPFQNNSEIEPEFKNLAFEELRGASREETPTPPADAVHDVGGLDVNPAESDSEDEWNYIKGDQAKSENLSSQPETVVETSEQDDAMSQLNPNAAEFVPTSPTRSSPSPACRALINDEVISQSPKRPGSISNVPSEFEFDCGAKSRPSDLDYKNGLGENERISSSSDQLESILNGKNIDEISEFHPGSTPTKLPLEEFHFGPNAAPFTPRALDQSEAFSTKANFGDDTEQTLNMSFNDSELVQPSKGQSDPMSMSFYAEKGESNPFQDGEDLNKVHNLPEDLDEFLEDNKENLGFNDTISDLPEHNPLGNTLDNDQAAIQTTDLDKISQDDEKELASPLEDPDDVLDATPSANVHLLASAPPSEAKLEIELDNSESQSPQLILDESASEEISSPSPVQLEEHSQIPGEVQDLLQSQSSLSNEPEFTNMQEQIKNVLESSNADQSKEDDLKAESPICQFRPKAESPTFILQECISPVCELKSAVELVECSFNPKSEVESIQLEGKDMQLDLPGSPVPACEYSADLGSCTLPAENVAISESPIDLLEEQKQEEEITSSVKDDESSPVEQLSPMKHPEPWLEEIVNPSDLGIEQTSEVQNESQTQEISAYNELSYFSCLKPTSQPRDQTEEQINLIETLASSEQTQEVLSNGFDKFASEFSEQICIKTDSIRPEFAEPAIVTPSEESKAFDEIAESPELAQPEVAIEKAQEVPASVAEPLIPALELITSEESKSAIDLTEPSKEAQLLVVPSALEVKEQKPEERKNATPVSSKKPIGKVEPRKSMSSPKVGAPKPAPKAMPKTGVAAKVPAKPGATKPAGIASKTSATSTAAPKPLAKPKTATTTSKPEKKPTTDAKPAPRTLTKKAPSEAPAIKTINRPVSATARPNLTKTTTAPKPAPTTRPATAPRTLAPKPASSAIPSKTTAPPKPRVPLSSRTTTATATSKTTYTPYTTTTAKTAANRGVLSPKAAPAAPKPRTMTTTAKPRVPLSKTVTKSADLEKEKKESANKLTASRTTTVTKTTSGTGTNRTTTTTVRKTEVKPLSNRTSAAKTNTTTTKSTTLTKKPVDAKVSSKTTTKIERPKENGVAPTNVIEEIKELTIVNNVVNDTSSEELLKDNSPLDNKLLIETSNALIDVNPAD